MNRSSVADVKSADLTSLAIRAAAELDAMAREGNVDSDFRQQLVDRLSGDLNQSQTGVVRISLSPACTRALASAMSHYQNADLRTLSDLYCGVSAFVSDLEELRSAPKKEKMEALRDVCLELHRQLTMDFLLSEQDKKHPHKQLRLYQYGYSTIC